MPNRPSPLAEFATGAAYPFRGLRMLRDGQVVLYTIVPFLLGLVLYAAALWLLMGLGGRVADVLIEPGAWWRDALRVLLWGAMVGVLGLAFVFTYSLVVLVIAAPLFELLSARVERLHTGEVREEEGGLRQMLVDVWRALTEAVRFLLVAVLIWVLGLVLPPVTTAIALLLTSVLVALEHMEGPMGRRRMTFRDKLAYARRHVWRLMGFGAVMTLAMLLPVIGPAAFAVGVCGGTMMFCDQERRDEANA